MSPGRINPVRKRTARKKPVRKTARKTTTKRTTTRKTTTRTKTKTKTTRKTGGRRTGGARRPGKKTTAGGQPIRTVSGDYIPLKRKGTVVDIEREPAQVNVGAQPPTIVTHQKKKTRILRP